MFASRLADVPARIPTDTDHAGSRPGTRVGRGLTLVATATVIGAVLPLLFSTQLVGPYRSNAVLEVKLLSDNGKLPGQIVETALRKVREPDNIDQLIRSLDLGNDPEFAAGTPSTLRFLSDIMARREVTVASAEAELRERVTRALSLKPLASGNAVMISADANDPAMAARLANIASEALERQIYAVAAHQEDVSVDRARAALEVAQAAVDGMEADTGEIAAMRRVDAERKYLETDEERIAKNLAAVSDQQQALSSIKPADVLTKPLPESLSNSVLEQQRRKRADAKLALDQLSAELGPRHPRFLAAKAALDDAESGVAQVIKSLDASLKQQKTSLLGEQKDIQARRAKLDAEPVSEAARKRLDLEQALENARKRYMDASRSAEAKTNALPVSTQVTMRARTENAVSQGYPLWSFSLWGALLGLTASFFALLLLSRDGVEHHAPEHSGMDTQEEAWEPMLFDDLPIAPAVAIGTGRMQDELLASPSTMENAAAAPAIEVRGDLEIASRKEEFVVERDLIAANEIPLSQRIEDVLMANRQPAGPSQHLPSLLSAILNGEMVVPEHARGSQNEEHAAEPSDEVTLEDLQRQLMDLKRQLSGHDDAQAA